MRLQSHPIRTVRGARHFFTAARAVSGATLLRLVLLRASSFCARFSLPCTHARGHARIGNDISPSTLSWTTLFSCNINKSQTVRGVLQRRVSLGTRSKRGRKRISDDSILLTPSNVFWDGRLRSGERLEIENLFGARELRAETGDATGVHPVRM